MSRKNHHFELKHQLQRKNFWLLSTLPYYYIKSTYLKSYRFFDRIQTLTSTMADKSQFEPGNILNLRL